MAKQEKTSAELYREERKARISKAAKKNQKKSITSEASSKIGKVLAILLVIALIGGICGYAVDQAGLVQRSKTAFSVGDIPVSQPEYVFYYMGTYNQVLNLAQQYQYYGMSIDFDSTKSPAEQEYSGDFGEIEDFPKDKTPTWNDYLEYSAKQQLMQVKSLVKQAEKLKITLDDEGKAAVESTIADYEENAKNATGTDGAIQFSLNAFLRYFYGKGVTKKLLTKIVEEQQLAQMVQDHKQKEFEDGYTDKQINDEYNKNINNYATITYRAFTVNAEKVKSGEGDDATEAVNDKTMAAAKKTADNIAKAANESEFKKLVSQAQKDAKADNYKDYLTDDTFTLHEDETYDTVSGSQSDDSFLKWAFDAKTAVNSTKVVKIDGTGYAVYMMVNPSHKAADTYTFDSRHILINFVEDEDDSDSEEDEEETTSANDTTDEDEKTTTEEATTEKKKEEIKVETLDTSKYKDVTIDLKVNGDTAKNKAGYKKAQDILEEYLKGEKTAEAFGELAKKYSEDTGSAENGGLYEGTALGDFVKPYEQWCMQDGRKKGDVGIVEVESSNYSGYHIIYYVGKNPVTWKDSVKQALSQVDLSEFVEKISKADDVKITNESDSVKQDVLESLESMIKRTNRNTARAEQ